MPPTCIARQIGNTMGVSDAAGMCSNSPWDRTERLVRRWPASSLCGWRCAPAWAVLRLAVANDILVDNDNLTVLVPKVADVSTADKANRILPDVEFNGDLAGAIHKITISGVVSP